MLARIPPTERWPARKVSPAAFEEKPVLRRLLELYLYDFTEFTGDD